MPTLRETLTDGVMPEGEMRQSLETDLDTLEFESIRERQLLDEQKQQEEGAGFWEVAGAAIEGEWIAGSYARYSERETVREYEPDFSISEDQLAGLSSQYNDRELEHIMGSLSEADMQSRLADVTEDRDRARVISEAGLGGTAAVLAAAILDPSLIVAAVASGPVALSAKTSRVANAVRMAGVTAAESAAVEVLLMKADTQRDWKDVVVAGLSGGVLGGAFGALGRVKALESDSQSLVNNLDALDVEFKKEAVRRTEEQAAEALTAVRSLDLETPATQLDFDRYEVFTKGVAARSELTPHKLAQVSARNTKNSNAITEIRATAKADIQKLWDDLEAAMETGGRKANDKLKHIDARIERVERRAEAKVLATKDILKRDADLMRDNNEVMKAREDSRKWDAMSHEERLDFLYPEGKPMQQAYKKGKMKKLDAAATRMDDDAAKLEEKYKEPEPETEGKSVGAAAVKNPLGAQFYSNEANEAERGWLSAAVDTATARAGAFGENVSGIWKSRIPKILLSDYTNIVSADIDELNALADKLLENPQGASSAKTVSALQWINDRIIRKAQNDGLTRGFDLYLKELGVSRGRGYLSHTMRQEFEAKVAHAVKGALDESDISDSIKLARDGVANQFRVAMELRKKYGELGFEDIGADANYFPDLMDGDKIHRMRGEYGWGEKEIKALITKGYMQGANEISEAQARLLSHIKWDSLVRSRLYDSDTKRIFRANSAADAERLMKEANVPQELIEAFFKDALAKDDWRTVSNRARKSLKIDWNAEHTAGGSTFRISDIMNTNTGQVAESYTQESAFGAAMAEVGIKSDGSLSRILAQAKQEAQASGSDFKAIDRGFEVLQNSITQLRGQPLVDYYGKGAKWNKGVRVALDATAVLRLQQVGFAQIPEIARTLTTTGVSEVLGAVKGSGMFRNPFNRGAGRDPETFTRIQEEYQELEEILGYVGEDHFNTTFSVREGDEGSELGSRLGGYLDRSLQGIRDIGAYASGHNTIQGGFEKISSRAISRSLLKDALGKKTLKPALRRQLEDAGMSAERWSDISDWLQGNSKTTDFEGRKIDLWNFEAMPDDMLRELQVTMTRIFNRNIVKGMVGETNSSWLGANGRVLTQFKTFSLISLEKLLLHDVKGNKADLGVNFLWGTALAASAYSAQMGLRALGMGEEEGSKYLEEQFSPINMGWGVLNKHSQLASVGLVTDVATIGGVMPAAMMNSNRYGYQMGNVSGFAPSLGLGEDVLNFTGSAASMLGSATGMTDKDPDDAAKKLWKDTKDLMPFTNTIILGEVINTLTGLNEDD